MRSLRHRHIARTVLVSTAIAVVSALAATPAQAVCRPSPTNPTICGPATPIIPPPPLASAR